MDNSRNGDNNEPTTEIVLPLVVDRLVQFMQKAQCRIDVCVDNTLPLLAIEFNQIRQVFIDARKSDIAIRYITEITKDNLGYCKELMSTVDELRHLDGIKGNFYVTEQEYVVLVFMRRESSQNG